MKRITFKSNYDFRFPDDYLNHNKQLSLVSLLYFGNDFEHKNEINKLIKRKIDSYIQQDKKQKRNAETNITTEESIQKLLESKLQCYYCRQEVTLINKMIKDKSQWTFDRIDNSKNHSCDNVVVCCLECNIQRGKKNSNDFLYGKQLKVNKTI